MIKQEKLKENIYKKHTIFLEGNTIFTVKYSLVIIKNCLNLPDYNFI